ncbi:MAG: isoprenylcysteine carboxylmethyltransferase family protein [Patulibacter sp.]
MPTLALVLYAAFFAVVFGWRTWHQLRTTGRSGFHGLSGRPGSAAWWGGVLFIVAIVLGVVAPGVQLAGVVAPLPALDATVLHVAGIVLVLGGIAVTVAAQRDMGNAWRIGLDHGTRTTLVTSGTFALVRNPVFSGMVVCAVGLASLAPNVLAIGGVVVLVLAIELQVRWAEEPFLRETLGDEYAGYATRVGRFVPGVGRIPAAD